jgi:ribosomal protein S18 acetylase RimI-like enzyme
MSSRFLIGEGTSFIENTHTLPLENEGLKLYRGWNDTIVSQLVERSKEEEIRRFTKRDSLERFADPQAAEDWYKEKAHVVYALGQKAALAGVAWFTQTSRPELGAEYTFAVRMYESQRGRGLAGALLEAAHKDFESHMQYEKNIWLEADESNERALHFYEKHGYERVNQKDGRVLMVRKGSAQRGQ